MRIAIDATAVPLALTGAGYYVRELIQELDQNESIELAIITRKNDKQRFEDLAPNSRVLNIAPNKTILRILFQTFRLGKIIDKLKVDVFHGPHYQLPLRMKTKSVITIHDMTLLTHRKVHQSSKRFYFTKMIPFAIKNADVIVTVSQHTANDIGMMGLTPKQVVVAPLGVNTSRFNENEDPDRPDDQLLGDIGIYQPFVSYLGLIEPRKCIPNLILAFSKIAKDFPEHKLIIAGGNGWGLTEVKQTIVDRKIATRIIFAGRLSDEEVPALFRQTEAFVYPSLYEGFGMPVLEAMACGAPVITTKSSSLSEVAGDAAVLVEPQNIDQLASKLQEVLSDKKLRNQLSKAGIERSKNFSWEKCAQKHIEAFELAMSDLI